MSMPLFLLLFALIVGSGAILLINFIGPKNWLYDYWNLDNEDDTPRRKLDVLRSPFAFYTASIVLVASVAIYLWLRNSAG